MNKKKSTKSMTQSEIACVRSSPATSLSDAVSRPSKNDLMISLKERWSENNRPFHFQHAFAILMGHIALLESHDAPLVHRASGFPLNFVSRLIYELLRSPHWQSDEGYVDLVRSVAGRDGVAEFDSLLGELINTDMFDNSVYTALQDEWYRSMGVRVEL